MTDCVRLGLRFPRATATVESSVTAIDKRRDTLKCPSIRTNLNLCHVATTPMATQAERPSVPLTDQAIAIIRSMPRAGRYVFPSDHHEKHVPFRANALTGVIKRAGFKATMHGMRTSFRNWGGESVEHNFRREVLEHCLSHRVGDEAKQSYWTADMIARRRLVMEAWANFVKPITKQPSLKLVG